jgi:hypothetical protein
MQRRSLRQTVDKWFTPLQRQRICLTRFRTGGTSKQRGVVVRLIAAADDIELRLFRHGDGTWRTFPRDARRESQLFAHFTT